MLQLVLQGIASIAVFAVLFVIGRVVLRTRGGGDEIKDIGLD